MLAVKLQVKDALLRHSPASIGKSAMDCSTWPLWASSTSTMPFTVPTQTFPGVVIRPLPTKVCGSG